MSIELPTILGSYFTGVANTTSTFTEVEVVGDRNPLDDKDFVHTESC